MALRQLGSVRRSAGSTDYDAFKFVELLCCCVGRMPNATGSYRVAQPGNSCAMFRGEKIFSSETVSKVGTSRMMSTPIASRILERWFASMDGGSNFSNCSP